MYGNLRSCIVVFNLHSFEMVVTKLENFPLNFALLISTSAQLFNPSSTVVDVPPKI